MRLRSLVTVALLAVVAACGGGSFLVDCKFDHQLYDDPIIFPNQPGLSHLHDFFGAKNAFAGSTYFSMQNGGTACGLRGDTASYWTPALYRNGTLVVPAGTGVRTRIYYTTTNLASGVLVEAPPPDLRLVIGNMHATSVADNPPLGHEIYWGCSDNSTGSKLVTPPPACKTGIISLHVGFPNCWNGVLTHANDSKNMVYPSGGECPPSYPRVLPRVILRWEYPVGTTTGDITLASGPPYTAHGDWWNTWDQAVLTDFVNKCLNAGVNCGVVKD